MKKDIEWILSKDDWISYRARVDLLNENISDVERAKARETILSDKPFADILKELEAWPGDAIKRHNDSTLLIHKLAFLADVGIKKTDSTMPEIIGKIKSTLTDEGIYPIKINLPTRFGGSGEDELLWMLCDAPLVFYSLAKMGLDDEPEIISGTRMLADLAEENGWRCAASSKLGNFGGPGRKGDPCPYANLLMLKLISIVNKEEFGSAAEKGIKSILSLWEDQGKRKERMFGIGTDFRKPKAPLIWFDIIHVLDVLSCYSQAVEEEGFKQMIDELENLFDKNGRLTALSMYRPWKDWEFSNKKEPSRWLTFLAYRILKRVNRL